MKRGDKLKLYSIEHIDNGRGRSETRIASRIWTIIDTYPHIVLCENENGTRESFTYWEIERYSKRPVRKVVSKSGHAV